VRKVSVCYRRDIFIVENLAFIYLIIIQILIVKIRLLVAHVDIEMRGRESLQVSANIEDGWLFSTLESSKVTIAMESDTR
jgi:hypothetical protein